MTIQNTYCSLLEYYAGSNKERGDGRLWDLKYINICLKGVFGTAALSEMGTIDFSDHRIKFVKGNSLTYSI